jgi:xylulokinase
MDQALSDVAGTEETATITSFGGPGGANSAWWKLKSAIVPTAFDRVSTTEPVAAGAAMLAGVRAGRCDPRVRLPHLHYPRITQRSYDARFSEFMAAALRASAIESQHKEKQ